jgi:uncharacterized protein
MIKEIVKLRESGLTFREIAKELNSTVGKVHYQWIKNKEEINTLFTRQFDIPQMNQQSDWVLPSTYNVDTLIVMPKNPTTIYLYWELSSERCDFIANNFGVDWKRLTKIIKIYDITAIDFNGANAHREAEIPLPEMTNNWFATNLEPNRSFIAEYGIRTDDCPFFTILRSNPVETPRNSVAQVGLHEKSVLDWKNGELIKPKWLENFSTYSYYGKYK